MGCKPSLPQQEVLSDLLEFLFMARSIKPMMGVELKVGLSSEAEFAALAIVFVSRVDWLKEIFDLGLSFAIKLASCWRL